VSNISTSVGLSLERKVDDLSVLSGDIAVTQRGVAKRVSYIKHGINVLLAAIVVSAIAFAAFGYFIR
jgi:hypothetical protein